MKVKIKSLNGTKPEYESVGAAGVDLTAYLPKGNITLNPGSRMLVPTPYYFELPEDTEAQVRPRSGLAINSGVTVLNSPGTIDSDYRGQVKVILINLSSSPFTINDGDRIAQAVFSKVEQVEFELVTELTDTKRGSGGFGHTGK